MSLVDKLGYIILCLMVVVTILALILIGLYGLLCDKGESADVFIAALLGIFGFIVLSIFAILCCSDEILLQKNKPRSEVLWKIAMS